MFALKKILATFLMPLSLGLIVFILGLFFLYRQSYGKAKFYLTVSFLWIVLISYAPLSHALLKPLESQYSKINLLEQSAPYILLLGGDFQARAYEAIRLHYLIHDSKIITSGYPGKRNISEALKNAQKLIELGIKKENILLQEKPRDTQEEAKMVKQIVGEDRFILVTSAYHMPRAMKIFEKEGLSPIPAPTDFIVLQDASLLSVPSGANLKNTEIAQHEYLGLLWHRIKTLFD